ncbi:MAG: hypothetical protein HC851_23325 [Acaryochloris sp. RU_4_1]|nr:hypothetical protein [Acaryochloris sp. RU_4_1]NJR57193.1 hypothetical protein [Acaryochloris sp. CRU_2_0]
MNNNEYKEYKKAFNPWRGFAFGLIFVAIAMWIVGDSVDRRVKQILYVATPIGCFAAHYLMSHYRLQSMSQERSSEQRSQSRKSSLEILEERKQRWN